jgi:DNA-binding transcriptional ArsR family regulator
MSDAQIEEVARLFATLSEPSRLKLLRRLMNGGRTVSELVAETGMKQGNVSKHLGVLLQARFVGRERDGNFARYSIVDPRLVELCHLMCGRVEADIRQRAQELIPQLAPANARG